MKKSLLFFLWVSPFCCFGQSLLLNGGFEEENICTEYKVNCSPEAWASNAGVFFNYFRDANRAYHGQSCMAIEAGHETIPYKRTFIRSQLLCRLRKGASYHLKFHIKSPHPVLDSIGVYFGSIDPLLERKPIHLLAPSLYLSPTNHFVKDSSWQEVNLTYTANGDELFFSIANFSKNDIRGNTGIKMERNFFVFLDDFSLLPMDPKETLCSNWKEVKREIYDQDERHEFLLRSLRFHRNDATQRIPTMPGSITTIDTLILPDVFFATAKRDLEAASFVLLDNFCRSIKGRVVDSLVIEGHTDNVGQVLSNEQLSLDRASAVGSYLRNCAYFFRAPFFIRGWGSRRPVSANDTPANRQRNRRVELFLYLRN